jgi:hypothetical protein
MNPFKSKITTPPSVVGETEFEDYYPRVHKNMAWSTYLSYINDVIDLYVLPFIGEKFYLNLLEKDNDETATEAEKKAIILLKRAVAYYAAMYAYPKEQDISTDTGNSQPNPDRAYATPIAVFKSKLWDLTITADNHLDALLSFLEVKVKGGDAKFNLYKNSNEYKNGKTDLFTDTFSVQEYHNINRSRRTYMALLPSILDATALYVIPKIGNTTYQAIVEDFKTNGINLANKLLIDSLRRSIVSYALVLAADTEGFLFDNQSHVRVVSNPDGLDNREAQLTARMKARQSAKSVLDFKAVQYLTNVCDYLKAHPNDYPAYTTEIINSNNPLRRVNRIVISRDMNGNVKGGIMF